MNTPAPSTPYAPFLNVLFRSLRAGGSSSARMISRLAGRLVIADAIRKLAGAILLLSAFGCAAPDVRRTDALFDELMHKSGLWLQLAQVEPMMQVGISQAHATAGTLPPEDLQRLQKAVAATYAADDLRTAASNRLSATLSRQDAEAVLGWLSSDLGRRITALEEAGSSPNEAANRQENGPRILAALSAARRKRVEHLANATLSAESAADLTINTMMGILHGLAAGAPGATRDTIDDLKAKLGPQRDRFVEVFRPRIVAEFAAMYQPLSDHELDEYIAFCDSPLGRRYVAASLAALDQALTDAAARLGRQLGSQTATLRTSPIVRLSPSPMASLA
jgi:hypothetical protein